MVWFSKQTLRDCVEFLNAWSLKQKQYFFLSSTYKVGKTRNMSWHYGRFGCTTESLKTLEKENNLPEEASRCCCQKPFLTSYIPKAVLGHDHKFRYITSGQAEDAVQGIRGSPTTGGDLRTLNDIRWAFAVPIPILSNHTPHAHNEHCSIPFSHSRGPNNGLHIQGP